MKFRFKKTLGTALLPILFAAFNSAQVSFPVVQTSGNRRFIEHTGREKALQGQLSPLVQKHNVFSDKSIALQRHLLLTTIGRSMWVQMVQPAAGL